MTRDDQIERFLAAVSDRMDADWNELERTSRNAEDRELVRNLRALRRIADHGAPLALAEEDRPKSAWAHLTLLERIGAGSYGEVHRAWDPKLSIDVALKLIPERLVAGDEAMREAQLLARVRHENVARVYGVDRQDGFVGIRTEYVDGVTLEDVAREAAPLPEARLLSFARQLLSALAAIHGAHVLHRDLKPGNVLVDREDRLVVTDFGCGAPRGPAGEDARAEFAGTPAYMAPELFAGGGPTPGTDCYALAVLLFRLATGRHPTDASTVSTLREAHARGERRRLADERPDLPPAFAASVDRALSAEPTKRFASARQWLEALGSAPYATPSGATPSGGTASDRIARARRPARRPVLLAAAAALGIACVAWLVAVRTGAPITFEAGLLHAPPDGAFAPVPPGGVATVGVGDRLMIRFVATRTAHVYVINWDDRGRAYLLFPMDASELRNPLPAGPHHLPGLVAGQPYAWEVSSGAGRESFAVIASTDPLQDFERSLAETPRVEVEALAGLLRGVGRATPVEQSPGARPEEVLEALRQRIAGDPTLRRAVSLQTLSIAHR